jgi:hypothetical protein
MSVCIAVDTKYNIRLTAVGLPEPSSKPWHERQRIITSVCDRLFGGLDASLRTVREACSSLAIGDETPETRGRAEKVRGEARQEAGQP